MTGHVMSVSSMTRPPALLLQGTQVPWVGKAHRVECQCTWVSPLFGIPSNEQLWKEEHLANLSPVPLTD